MFHFLQKETRRTFTPSEIPQQKSSIFLMKNYAKKIIAKEKLQILVKNSFAICMSFTYKK
jgi:hypothetical protein